MRFLLDTTVIVDLLRGLPAAATFIDQLEQQPYLSAVTVAELYAGVREGPERRHLEQIRFGFAIVPVDDQIAADAGLFRREYGRSHGTSLADALIAACAASVRATLVTHNRKHFPMLKDAVVPYR